ncbi:MAG: folate-binding protein [Cyanobacteriota bacterium]|nr:folate-binding protein [Cyanobacteriota bacterium]
MIQQLRDFQTTDGATIEDSPTGGTIPISFGNDRAAMEAVKTGVALCDRSHWGLLQVADEERLKFLHNQSTNNIESIKPGRGCDTVFVNSTARTLDLATVYVAEDAALILVSPNRRQQLLEWLDRYIFPFDKVALKDVSSDYAIFSLIGPETEKLLEKLDETTLANEPHATHKLINLAGAEVRLAAGSGLATAGSTLIVPVGDALKVWQILIEKGAVAMGDRLWQQLRIEQGRPAPDCELTEDYNPLEAGLWQTISFDKGCYIGQETIARLNTYKGVKQQLWGIRLSATAEPGTVLTAGEEKVGKLTSCTETEDGYLGLGYVRVKAGGVGLKVRAGDVEGEVVEVPFLTRGYL